MTPDNGAFATAAYIIAAIVYVAYVASIKLRERRLRERMAQLDASSRPNSHRAAGA
jgi:hypothetical protein